jgi:hypothetical protein
MEDEMSDVLARLMRWMETSDIDDADVVLRDAITEIAGLRARLHEHRIAAQRLAGGQPMLTDEEREAIAWAINKTAQAYDDPEGGPIKREAMRGLL